MAIKSSFKQPCPSCEAMVPIRDPKLIGRKIDCPKCKYRFIVEEPAEEEDDVEELDDEPKKGKAKAAGSGGKKASNGKPAKPAPRRGDDDEDEEVAPAKKKKSGGSPMLIVGIGLAAVAVVALAVGGIFLFSGDKDSPKSSGGRSANGPPPSLNTTETKPNDPTKTEAPPAPKPRQEDVTNLLPNDAQAVLNLPLEHLLANPRVKQALVDAPGAFSDAAFQRIWGVGSKDVQRVVLACNTDKKTVFSVMRTKTALKEEQIIAALRLKPEAPVGTAKYYLLTKPLDALSTFLLHDAMRLMLLGGNGPRDKIALHFIDPFTVACANVEPMKQFLQEKGQPKHLSKTAEEEAASKAPTGPGGSPGMRGGPGGMSPGGPGRPGAPGAMSPGGPGKPGGPGPAGAPGSTGKARGPSGGANPSSPMPMPPSGGSPSTGKANGPPSTGKAGGGYRPPSGMPSGGMPPGMYPGRGSSASDAAPVSTSYLTVEPQLKAILDQIEKVDGEESQVVLVSFALNTTSLGSMESFLKTVLTLLRGKIPLDAAMAVNGGLALAQQHSKAVGLALTQINDKKLDGNVALATKEDKLAKEWETTLNKAHDLISFVLSKRFGLDIVAKNAGRTNNSGMPGGPPGMGPGGYPPQNTPPGGGFQPPGQPPGGGYGPGMPQPNSEKPEEKGKDGDYLIWTKDDVFALGAHFKMDTDRFKTGGEGLDFAGIYLRGMTAAADRRSRLHELAAALQTYFDKEGHFPRGAVPRDAGTHVIDWRPDQRLSWMTEVLPYLGNGEYKALKRERNATWYEDTGNAKSGFTVIPQFLASASSSPPLVPYPNITSHGPGLWAATHYVGIAGVGLDAAEYRIGDTATAKLCGVFGYDRETKKADIKDGLSQTIVAIQVPPEPKSPWIAGGGSTVRGVSNDLDCVRPFVCAKYPNKDGKEVDGTFAIMADGKVRFIPATIDPKTFQALCTIAGDDKVSNLDAIAPEVPPPEEPQQPELKTEIPAPAVVNQPEQPAPRPQLSPDWEEITSQEGRYTAVVPAGKRIEKDTNEPSLSGGAPITGHRTLIPLAGNTIAYVIGHSDAAPGKRTEAMLYSEGMLQKSPNDRVVYDKKFTLDGNPGREFQVDQPGKSSMFTRIVLVKNRLYQLMVAYPVGKADTKAVRTFFDSFKLTGK